MQCGITPEQNTNKLKINLINLKKKYESIQTVAVWVASRLIERLHAAGSAEHVLGLFCIELIGHQIFRALNEKKNSSLK
jgi:hypothetical protein